jgi:hypothetical protein
MLKLRMLQGDMNRHLTRTRPKSLSKVESSTYPIKLK